MAQIQSGNLTPFTSGQVLTATDLNSHVSSATLLPGAITDQTVLATALSPTDDLFLVYDFSVPALRKATVSQIVTSGADVNTSLIQPVSGGTGNITLQSNTTGNLNINGTLTGSLNITTTGALVVTSATGSITMPNVADTAKSIRLYGTNPILFDSYTKFNTTDAVKLPTGTTGQRPAVPNQGDIRFNSTNLIAEVYNGTIWEEVGGGPFDATGGNKIIAPDAVATSPISATFSSANGESVVVTSAAHSVVPGQVVLIATAVTGYSGKWTVVSANTNDFTFIMTTVAAPNSGTCTYKKSGAFKCHIFTSSGTFTAGIKESGVEVLVVGGGAGGATGGSYNGGGGGGAVCYYPYYTITSGQIITVTVGNGGAISSNGSASVFGSITAGGGLTGTAGSGGSGGVGGASGSGFSLCPSNAGGISDFSGSNSAHAGGGGGGAGGVGNNGNVGGSAFPEGGDGGDGRGSSITGIASTYGGGGAGGGRYQTVGFATATASNGGGSPSVAGLASSGGGGGGGTYTSSGAAGGSGIVIVRYPYWV
jgi:hypothetical protein